MEFNSDNDSQNSEYYINSTPSKRRKIRHNTETFLDKERKDKFRKCPGCYPYFQENQLGHIGPNGCLGNDF